MAYTTYSDALEDESRLGLLAGAHREYLQAIDQCRGYLHSADACADLDDYRTAVEAMFEQQVTAWRNEAHEAGDRLHDGGSRDDALTRMVRADAQAAE